MADVVRVEPEGDVAVVVIDNPPINASSLSVRAGILAAVEAAAADPAVNAVVLIGAGSTFIAGADLKEFGQPLADPQNPAVIAAIEACAKPVVAALHGAALGGGFEIALGCDARVALAETKVGLPEVTLGIIPGAGGTQRLPRLTGIPKAVELVCKGARIGTEEALALGMIDAVAPAELRAAAVAHARAMIGKNRLRDRPVPDASPEAIEAAAAAALKAGRGRPAVRAAIAAITVAAETPIDEGLAAERAAFQELRTSREARALRHQFFAEREAAKLPGLDAKPRPLARVAVLGAGTMGTGIAISSLDAGLPVTLVEQDAAALDRGRARISDFYAGRVARGALTAEAAAAREGRLTPTLDWDSLGEVDLVIEAVFEDLDVKREVFKRLDAVARPGAVLASNTSYLDLDAIAAATSRPEDVVGLHFFSPANVMRLLEVVRGAKTAPDTLATGLALGRRLGKVSVVSGNAFGFIGNRIYAAYRRQCEFLLEEGASPAEVDAALEGFGFAMGPFAVGDMSGLDIAWRMRQSTAASRDPSHRYVTIPDRLCEAGRLGRKTGAGYYRYEDGKRQPDPATVAIIDAARAEKGIVPRAIAAEEIVERALLAMVNEACLLLGEGVAPRASDVDVVLTNGYGFPKWEGGPVFWATERGAAMVARNLDRLEEASGAGFQRGDLAAIFAAEPV
ncbi:3-hydroxyacyl-CoA dehydrogenase NAD-binding domain-containing protein [Amaricoccus solimangrovi]|uniref:3-hydroxyacyl-CoA dehydrogenase n=1 Tax=Amaricoccus solimangrovi TaxID=2589815 RepID=A0A501WDL3_9RHOB|nr:3-hydroxyacyl-CoA dehydrogenase NAD-binding domain-containing protein [Amaricoccus solimangrovi]TPE47478.1 3-hydroxyacyl-CoA dehydrogenase [Amaricoccus solimangrovi]